MSTTRLDTLDLDVKKVTISGQSVQVRGSFTVQGTVYFSYPK